MKYVIILILLAHSLCVYSQRGIPSETQTTITTISSMADTSTIANPKSGDIAYVNENLQAIWNGSAWIIESSVPIIPTLDSLYDIPYPVTQASSRVWTECIVVYDNILYWVPGSSGDTLRIYDLNSEDQPVLLSAEITGVGASQPVLLYDNKKLYLSKAGTLNNVDDVSIIDVSDPKNPVKYPIGGGIAWNYAFAVKNGMVYTWGDRNPDTGDNNVIYSLDVSDLNNLDNLVFGDTLVITAFSGGGEDQLHVSGDNLYAVMNYTTTKDSFEIFKIGIENPDSLYLKSSKRFVGEGGFSLSAVRDDFIYLVDNADTLEIYDFRGDTLKLVSKTNIPFGESGPSAFAKLQGNYLYASNRDGYIDVVDVTDISNPFAIGRYPTIGNHRGSTVWGDRYVAGSRNNGAGVRVHKIGISKHPVVSTGTILSGEGRIDRLKSKNINSETISTDNLILDKAKNASALGTNGQGEIIPVQMIIPPYSFSLQGWATDGTPSWSRTFAGTQVARDFLETNTYYYGTIVDYDNNGNWISGYGVADNRGQFFDMFNYENIAGHSIYGRLLSGRGNANLGVLPAQEGDLDNGLYFGQKVSGAGDSISGGYSYNFVMVGDNIDSVNTNFIFNNFRFKQNLTSTGNKQNVLSFLHNGDIEINRYGSSKSFQTDYTGILGTTNTGLVRRIDPNHLVNNSSFATVTSTSSPQTVVKGDNLIKQGSTQASFTFNLPASPTSGDIVHLTFLNEVTALTISGNGNPITQTATTAPAGSRVSYKYYGADGWVQIQ